MSTEAGVGTPGQAGARRRVGAAELREFAGVALVLLGLAGVLLLLVVEAVDGEWGRVALVVGAAVLLAVGRWLARYDPRAAAARRAQRAELARLQARLGR